MTSQVVQKARPLSAHIWLLGRQRVVIIFYYMASSGSGQDEPNCALWLATRAGKMGPSCALGTTHCIPQVKCSKSHIIDPLLTKFVLSRWLDIGLAHFLRVYGPRLRSRSINTQKNNLANIQPSWPRTWSITHTSNPFYYSSVKTHWFWLSENSIKM